MEGAGMLDRESKIPNASHFISVTWQWNHILGRSVPPVLFILMSIMFGTAAWSQTPAHFNGLLTTSTDYTCAGTVPCATWPMPPIPAPGGSYVDPTWGTTTYRLAVPSANTSGRAVSTYSRVQAWNSNDTRMFLTEATPQGYLDLYDVTTTPPTPINRILTDVGIINSASLDALWAYTDPNRVYYIPGTSSGAGHSLELRYVDVSACTPSNCTLTSHLVHTFSCMSDANTGDIPAGTVGNKIETGSGGQGGMFDKTDRYFSFTCDKVDGAGRHEIDFIRYDRQTDTVTTQIPWYHLCPGKVATGCAVWSKTGLRHNLIRMNQHPDSRFITVIWQCGARDANWSRGCGTEVFDPSYNFLGVASPYNGHQDVGYDVRGVPVLVGVGTQRLDVRDERAIEITDLTKLSATGVSYKRILLPCSYSRQTGCDSGVFLGAKSGASHISMTGSWGSLPGYGLFSTMMLAGPYRGNAPDYPPGTILGTAVSSPGDVTVTPGNMGQIGVGVVSTIDTGKDMKSVTWSNVTPSTATATFAKPHASNAPLQCLSCGDTGFGAMENFAIKIDANAPDNSPAVFYRIGRTMAIRDNDYNAEPHTAVNRDFTQITWGSTWNEDPTNSLYPVYGFWTKLSSPTH
jgi:hypothetical protein